MERSGSTATVEPQGVTASSIDPPDRARPGTAEAVAQATAVFREYGGFIRAAIRFQAAGKFDGNDVFQEFFLRLVASPVSPNAGNMSGYLWCSVRYLLIDWARRRTMERRHWGRYARGTADIPDDGPVRNLIRQEEQSTTLAAVTHRTSMDADFLATTEEFFDCRRFFAVFRVTVTGDIGTIGSMENSRTYLIETHNQHFMAGMGLSVRTAAHLLCAHSPGRFSTRSVVWETVEAHRQP